MQVRWSAVRICICLGLICGMLMSWRLWLSSGRQFPVLPCFGLGAIPAPIDWILFLGTLGLACVAMWQRWNAWVICALVGLLVVLGIFDQMRWQPWAYQYLLSFVPMAFVSKKIDEKGMLATLDVVRLILIACYVWSGIHKFGVQFQRTYEAEVIAPFLSESAGWWNESLLFVGKCVPWFEVAIGICLLLPWTRCIGIWMAMGMHAFILISLGPFGGNINSVIWPWNVVMPFLVLALFWKYHGFALRGLWSVTRLRAVAVGVVVLVVVMPTRSAVHKWDQYLSFHLYSGYQQRMMLVVQESEMAKLDASFTEMMEPAATQAGQSTTHQTLPIPKWAMLDLNVPMPSENRLQLMVAKYLSEELQLTDGGYFFYRDYPKLLKERGFAMYPPSEIRRMKRFPPFKNGDG